MAYLDWKPEYAVGVPDIDRQHQRLVSLINRLHGEMKRGAPKEALEGVLRSLVDYTRTHFRDEERAMEQARYPGLAGHRREHEELTRTILRFQDDLQAGRVALSIQLLNFLKAWLRDHILKSDQAYAPSLRARTPALSSRGAS